jgi:pyrroloquinoline-quinone synthase
VASCRSVLPGVRFACDGYVALVRERSLLEAVASSLTEFFAPDLMSRRVLAWEQHYPWVSPDMLAYFRSRVPRARRDSEEAVGFVVRHATTYDLQARCVDALIRKTEILWHLLDCAYAAYVEPGWGPAGARA